ARLESFTLSLHGALPICRRVPRGRASVCSVAVTPPPVLWLGAPAHPLRRAIVRSSNRAACPAPQDFTVRTAARRFPRQRPLPVRSEEHTSELQSRENLVC